MRSSTKRVYVAGKLNDDAVGYIKNLHVMIKAADAARRAGYAVFIPGMDFLAGLVFGNWTYADYFENSQPWLLASDAVLVLSNWRRSKGTQREIALARQHKIPVFFSLDDLVKGLPL